MEIPKLVLAVLLICLHFNVCSMNRQVHTEIADPRKSAAEKVYETSLHSANSLLDKHADSAILYCNQAINAAVLVQSDSMRYWALALRARVERLKSKDDFGKQEIREIMPYAVQAEDTALIMFSLYENMLYHLKRDELQETIKNARKSISYATSVSDSSRLTESYVVLGLVARKRQAYEEAFYYLDKAGTFARGRDKSIVIGKQASVMSDQGDVLGALQHAKKSLVQNTGTDQSNHLFTLLNDLGTYYLLLGKYDSATHYSSVALAKHQQVGNLEGVADASFNMARIYEQKEEYEKCREYAQLALETAIKINARSKQACFHKFISRIDSNLGDFETAYASLLKSIELKEQLFDQKRLESINELEVKYQTNQKETENEMLRMDQELKSLVIERQKIFLVVAISTAVIILAFLFFILRLSRKRKKDAEHIIEQKETLEQQSQKLRQIDSSRTRFFANISHDLKTPMTLLQGFFDTLSKEDNYLNAKTEKALETAGRNLRQLHLFTDEIRDLTLLENNKLQLKFTTVDICTLIKLNTGMFLSKAEVKGISLHHECNLKPGTLIKADIFNLEKVLHNLIGNAIKYTQQGGKVLVKSDESDGQISMSVHDNGHGIPRDEVPYVFDRFFQSSKNDHQFEEGLGIGLALVKEIVDLHGGNVKVFSLLGSGSSFIVTIPKNLDKPESSAQVETYTVSDADAGRSGQVNRGMIDPEQNRKHGERVILIVEDHPDIADYIASILREQYILLSASNGREAQELLETQKVDMVLTDLMMPFMDGFELIEFIKSKEHLKHIEVMVLSARSTSDDRKKILHQGVNDFMSKPFNSSELKQRITNCLEKPVAKDTFAKIAEQKGHFSDIEKNLVGKLNKFILDKVDDPSLGVAALANLLNTSERNVHRIIKELTGSTPKAYIRKLRIDYAENLIRKKKVKSVLEATRAVGMINSSSFSSQFEKIKGLTPKELINA